MWWRGGDPPPAQLEMITFSIDPQWCGLLFSVYCRHEKGSTGVFPQPDALAACSYPSPPLDADWIALAGSFGFELCQISSTWALVLESVKATSVIFLLGVGSLVCYKLYNYCWPRSRPRLRSPDQSPTQRQRHSLLSLILDEGQLVEDFDEEEADAIQGHYFGPTSPTYEDTQSVTSQDGSDTGTPYLADQSSSSPSSDGTSMEDGQDGDVSDESHRGNSMHVHKRVRQRGMQSALARQHHNSQLHSLGHSSHSSHVWRRPKHFSTPHSSLSSNSRKDRERLFQVSEERNPDWLTQKIRSMTPLSSSKVVSGSLSHLIGMHGRQEPHGELLESERCRRSRHDGRTDREIGSDYFSSFPNNGNVHSGGVQDSFSKHSSSQCLSRDESYDSLGFSDSVISDDVKYLLREGSFDSTCSELSIDFSIKESADTNTVACMEKLQQEIDQLKNNCLKMDEEFETIKCNRNFPGMSCLMKANADDTEHHGASPSAVQEGLKKEEARACFAGLYSITTIKNSTSSEFSDSFAPCPRKTSLGSVESLEWDSPKLGSPGKTSAHESPSLFKKIHSYHSIEEQKSDQVFQDVHSVEETHLTLSPKISAVANQNSNGDVDSEKVTVKIPETPDASDSLLPSEAELMANLEWDNEDLTQYPEGNSEGTPEAESSLLASVDTLEMDLEAELCKTGCTSLRDEGSWRSQSEGPESAMESMISSRSCTASPVTERSCKLETSAYDTAMADSSISMQSSYQHNNEGAPSKDHCVQPWTCWSSEESGYMEWDAGVECQRPSQLPSPQEMADTSLWEEPTGMALSSSASEQSTPATDIPPQLPRLPVNTNTQIVQNIGEKVKILQYALQEWHGDSNKTDIMIKGYAEIPSRFGLEYVRRIRGDNYCAVRAAIFQALARGLPIPNGADTFQRLSLAFNNGCNWLQEWKFAGRLPYHGSNVLHGIKLCLESLDTLASVLTSVQDKEPVLAKMLNCDPALDLHVVEAVKLHMLLCAMELHSANINGADVPVFAVLMFARDSSETPKDFMNNHLQYVGDSGGLEQVEMFLLGYTLGVTLQVIRPGSYGSDDYVCYYPDWNVGTWPQIIMIAEDDRHYNILTK